MTTSKSGAPEAAAKGHGGNRAFLTQNEAAELLRISPRTLERMRLDSSGPRFVKAGRRVLYKLVLAGAHSMPSRYRSTPPL